MPHKEKLAIEHRRRRVFRLKRIGGVDERLLTQVHRFLGDVIEDGGLPSEVSAFFWWHHQATHLNEIMQLRQYPHCPAERRIPCILPIKGLELE
jgi:hypothetical protein